MMLSCINIKKVNFSLPFRWFPILAIMLTILFFVILTHILVEKCTNYCSNEISDAVVDMESQESDEPLITSIVDSYTVANYIIIMSTIVFVYCSYHYHLLSPRMSLLLTDSDIAFECLIAMPNYYLKNPLLRHYIWKKILIRSTTVQPENNQMELQSISIPQSN